MKKLGLVLSGGGIKGIAHIALLDYLEKLGHKPDIISGTSAGAIVGSFYAAGMKTSEMLEFFRSGPLFNYYSMFTWKPGLLDSSGYLKVYKDYLPATFEELKIPMHICAVNIEKVAIEYFGAGDIYRPLVASCAYPPIFSPLRIKKDLYVDGGIMDNFPIEPLLGKADIILGSYLGRPYISDKKKDLNSTVKIMNYTSTLTMYASVVNKFKLANQTLEYPLYEFGTFNQQDIDKIYNIGMEVCKKELKPEFFI